jgi:lactate dehydrogenase-like 2-hydroxyacid dehydrogenase
MKLLLKLLTLSFFLSLIIGFVAVKAGNLTLWEPKEKISKPEINIPSSDTVPRKEILSSSKSIIINMPVTGQQRDSIRKAHLKELQETVMMVSSKVGPIIQLKDLQKLRTDTIKQDTIKQ